MPQPKQRIAYNSDADEIFFGGSAGGGKALSINTEIPTINEWKKMEDIAVGDIVFDENGEQCTVLAVSQIEEKETCKLTFSDGGFIVSDLSHLWVTETYLDRRRIRNSSEEWRSKRKSARKKRGTGKKEWLSILNSKRNYNIKEYNPKIKTTKEIVDTFYCENSKRLNHSIPVCNPLITKDIDLPIAPYTFGAWLGDGTSKGGGITGIDEQIFKEIAKDGFLLSNRKDVNNKGILGLQVLLKKINVFNNKHIPKEYLRASVKQRISLLQGLMDTDGYCDNRGQCEISLVNKSLIEGVLELIRSLGIKANISIGRALLKGKDCGERYRIKFLSSIPVFRLDRKLKRQKLNNFRGTHSRRYICSYGEIKKEKVKCIQVSSSSGLYLASKYFIPTHNSDLLLAVPYYEHNRSIIFRREYKQLRALIDRSRQIYGEFGDYNKTENRWTIQIPKEDFERIIEFGACQHIGDEQAYQGIPHDFIGFDEITHFSYAQYKFLTGWNRSNIENQRCRIICTGNPPTDSDGEWVIWYWRAWLDEDYPSPAKPGELRWFTTIDGVDTEVDEKEIIIKGEKVKAKSRTFIPARVEDNKYLMESGYKATLQSLPEPFRSKMLYGNFSAGREDNNYQVIPRDWIIKAQARWAEKKISSGKLSIIGVDVARGGKDRTVFTLYYDDFFVDKQICIPGDKTSSSKPVVDHLKLIMATKNSNPIINVDVIGVGGAVYDALVAENIKVVPLNSSNKSNCKDNSGKLDFKNKRAEWWWKLREALDPDKGSRLCIPIDNELMRELCTPQWKLTASGLQIESKDDIIKRVGRSIDKADSFVYACCTHEKIKPAYMLQLDVFSR